MMITLHVAIRKRHFGLDVTVVRSSETLNFRLDPLDMNTEGEGVDACYMADPGHPAATQEAKSAQRNTSHQTDIVEP